jgi:ribose 5-phosphate isomerase B
MKIYIGTDHRGFNVRGQIAEYLRSLNHEVLDEGDEQLNPDDDFPVFAVKVAKAILADNSDDSRGILICGSGQGMCMAANRFKGIRASMCFDEKEAYSARHDDNCNVLCLSADRQPWPEVKPVIDTWLNIAFDSEPRRLRRLNELDNLN